MPLTALGHRHRIALGKQSAEGTAQGTPAFEMPAYDGDIGPNHDEREHEVTAASDMVPGYYIARADWSGQFTVPSFPTSIPHIARAHLGTLGTTGAGDPYSHAITKASTKPFETVYLMRPGIQGGSDVWERGVDGFFNTLELQGTKGEPLKWQVGVIGKTHEMGASAPTPTVTDRLDSDGDWHTMIGATLNLDLAATPATTQKRNIESLVVRSEYADAEFIQTDELTPRYLNHGRYRIGGSITMVLENYDAYRSTFHGAVAGTALSPVVVVGSALLTFQVGPVANANRTLVVALPSVRWESDKPTIDPGGESIRTTLTAKLQEPASGEPITITAKNASATVA